MDRKPTRLKFSHLNQGLPTVDRENGIIRGVAVITGDREALGHEIYVDETTVNQVVAAGQEADKGPGLKARFDHPNACFRSIGTAVGRFRNFRKEGLKAKADLHLLDAAASSPEGDLRTHILDLAEEDPDIFATSIVFTQDTPEEFSPEDFPSKDPEDAFFFPHARIDSLYACDIVDEGAANDGLFGRPDYLAEQAEKWGKEHPEILVNVLDNYFKSIGIDLEKLKQLSMSETTIKEEGKSALASFVEGVKSLTAKFTPEAEADEEVTEEVETPEAIAEEVATDEVTEPTAALEGEAADETEEEDEETTEDATVEATAELAELEAEELTSLKSENEDLKTKLSEVEDTINSLNDEIAKLSGKEIGEPITVGGAENVQDPAEGFTQETLSEKKSREKDERIARQIEARNEAVKRKFGEGAFGIYN